jgi:hypothetical protein
MREEQNNLNSSFFWKQFPYHQVSDALFATTVASYEPEIFIVIRQI